MWLIPLLSGDHSSFIDCLAILLTNGLTWIPLYLVMLFVVVRNNESIPQIVIILGSIALCLLLTAGVDAGIVKPMVHRLRPLNDPAISPMLTLTKGMAASDYSFFSAHAANTMVVATFFSLLLRNIWSTVALFCWSLLNCWTRIYLCMHYPSDIAAGLLWGMIVGCIVYSLYLWLHKKVSPRLHFISSAYTRTGYAHSDIFLMINVLLLTIMGCIFYSLWLVKC